MSRSRPIFLRTSMPRLKLWLLLCRVSAVGLERFFFGMGCASGCSVGKSADDCTLLRSASTNQEWGGDVIRALVFRISACILAAAGTIGIVMQSAMSAGNAQWPTKPIRMVVPSAPGGGTDIVARLIAQGLQEAWGQTVVVDNRGGAGGIPAVTMVATNSMPDGYTMCLGSNGHLSFAPAIRRNLQ